MFQYMPDEGYCIPFRHVCDKIADCPYGTDEENCTQPRSCPGLLKCKKESLCVSMSDASDGIPDCLLSRDDEKVCPDFYCPMSCNCDGMVVVCEHLLMSKLNSTFIHILLIMLFLSHNYYYIQFFYSAYSCGHML